MIAKPEGTVSLSIDRIRPMLVETVRAAAGARLRPTLRLADRIRHRMSLTAAPDRPPPPALPRRHTGQPEPTAGLILIGASTGGPQALETILTGFPEDLPWPVLVAQHMPASFTGAFAQRLDRICPLPVEEVRQSMPLLPGRVHVARGDADLIVARRPAGLIATPVPSSPTHRWHPSVDRMVTSALNHVPAGLLVGVLVTGMGDDGAVAMARLSAEGGHTIAQDEETAVVWECRAPWSGSEAPTQSPRCRKSRGPSPGRSPGPVRAGARRHAADPPRPARPRRGNAGVARRGPARPAERGSAGPQARRPQSRRRSGGRADADGGAATRRGSRRPRGDLHGPRRPSGGRGTVGLAASVAGCRPAQRRDRGAASPPRPSAFPAPGLLADRDADVRLLSAEIARGLPAAEATALLCGLLERENDVNVCTTAVEILAEIGTPDAVPVLRGLPRRFPGALIVAFAVDVATKRIAGAQN